MTAENPPPQLISGPSTILITHFSFFFLLLGVAGEKHSQMKKHVFLSFSINRRFGSHV
ncbi:hypothetical protein OIU77_012878 [Salix suchowensis]|uniref:Uncharacterized protein n=1 Tax=Salix suchowensis TaxID=1278906 RepID=A0ABQ9A7G6_9ROSI|nr:hypothetical protein OIU77_012878 [Salix suchowensis]